MFGFFKSNKDKAALKKLEGMANGKWKCEGCGKLHSGLFDLASEKPNVDGVPDEKYPNSALDLDGTILTEDFCVIRGANFIVRTVLEIPIQGLQQTFGFGVWSSLSEKNFKTYVENFDEGH